MGEVPVELDALGVVVFTFDLLGALAGGGIEFPLVALSVS